MQHQPIKYLHKITLCFMIASIAGLLLHSFAAQAQSKRMKIQYSSGTGFFVSRAGHIITNSHVLQNCQSIQLQGNSVINGKPAKLIARDSKYDLALIKTHVNSPQVANLRRAYTPPEIGEQVMLLGYPGDAAKTGKYSIEYSLVKKLAGPMGEKHYLQFRNSAKQGNSGGPLLDFAGNVIGVITAKVQLYKRNVLSAKNEMVESSDVAITLPILEKFLRRHGVMYQTYDSLMQLSKHRMERKARKFTVNILCKQSEIIVN